MLATALLKSIGSALNTQYDDGGYNIAKVQIDLKLLRDDLQTFAKEELIEGFEEMSRWLKTIILPNWHNNGVKGLSEKVTNLLNSRFEGVNLCQQYPG